MSFLVDPQYEGHVKSEAIWAIGASAEAPQDRLAAERGVAFSRLAKGRLSESLRALADQLDEHRRRSQTKADAR